MSHPEQSGEGNEVQCCSVGGEGLRGFDACNYIKSADCTVQMLGCGGIGPYESMED